MYESIEPMQQQMTCQTVSIFSDKTCIQSECLALEIEQESQQAAHTYDPRDIVHRLKNDTVLINLQRILAAFKLKDDLEYCFDLSNNFLLTVNGFVMRTRSVRNPKDHKSDLQRWVNIRESQKGIAEAVFDDIKRAIEDLARQDTESLDKSKKRLGANTHLRDIVPESLICDPQCCHRTDCPMMEMACFCLPCCWPFYCLITCISSAFENRYGTRFDDPRQFCTRLYN